MTGMKETLDIPKGWSHVDDKLTRTIPTQSYAEAVELTLNIANIADAMNHHPEILLTYSGIEIFVWSHDVSSVTGRDVIFALAVNTIVDEISGV